jgi:hypothetical protein
MRKSSHRRRLALLSLALIGGFVLASAGLDDRGGLALAGIEREGDIPMPVAGAIERA